MAKGLKGSSAQRRGTDPGSATLDSKPRAATCWLRPQARIWPLRTWAAHFLQEVIIMVVGHAGVQSQGKPAGVGQAWPLLALTKAVGSGSPQELLRETLPGHPAYPLKGSIGTWLLLP